MITAKMEKQRCNCSASAVPVLLEGNLIEALQVGYVVAKEGVNFLFNMVGEVIIDTTQQGKMDSRLMRNIETLTRSDRFLDAITL